VTGPVTLGTENEIIAECLAGTDDLHGVRRSVSGLPFILSQFGNKIRKHIRTTRHIRLPRALCGEGPQREADG
jgi:hypothetical protein